MCFIVCTVLFIYILYLVLILLQTDRPISPFPSSIPKYLDAERDGVMKLKLVLCLGHKGINLDLTQWTAFSWPYNKYVIEPK